jgi:hypothetical protein
MVVKKWNFKAGTNRFCKGENGEAVPITNLVGLFLFWMSR